MKLTKETLAILKNYASINQGIIIHPGNVIMTKSVLQNIFADVTVPETFEQEFAIFDLNEFLQVISMLDDPELTFSENYVLIQEGGRKTKYYFSQKELIVSPKSTIQFPEVSIEFVLTNDDFVSLQKAASILKLSSFSLIRDEVGTRLIISDKENVTSNNYSIDIDAESELENFTVNIDFETLKLMPFDYNVSVSQKNIARFASTDEENTLQYMVALEADSTYE